MYHEKALQYSDALLGNREGCIMKLINNVHRRAYVPCRSYRWESLLLHDIPGSTG